MHQALSGIRVLDLSTEIAGPYCCKHLGDFGADVIKIEPPQGDPARRMGPFPGDIPHAEKSALFLPNNRNKRGITLNISTFTGQHILHSMVREADILVTSYSPAEIEALDLTYEALSQYNPHIVVTAITPYGMWGPYRDYQVTEIVLNALGHSMSSMGVPDREPLRMGNHGLQYFAGYTAAVASLGAYMSAQRCGRGQLVDVSLVETAMANVDRRSTYLLRYQYTGKMVRREARRFSAAALPTGFYPCSDGWVLAGFFLENWQRFVALMDRQEWLSDPRFHPPDQKLRTAEHREYFDLVFLEWLLARTKQEVVLAAAKTRSPVVPVDTPADLLEDQHLKEREFWVEVDHSAVGTLSYTGAPFKMSDGGYQQRHPAPLLGEHNREIYQELLGYTGEELTLLSRQGVI